MVGGRMTVQMQKVGMEIEAEVPQARWAQIYAELRRRIISCELAPGASVSEVALAREYSVSPTPVRDALSRLRQEGLVSPANGRSYQVTPISLSDFKGLGDARFILESGVVRMLIAEASDQAIDALSAIARLPNPVPTEAADLIGLNRAFHLGVAKLTGNHRIVSMLTRILDESERLFNLGIISWPVRHLEETHLELIDALRRRDVDRAVAICLQETQETNQRVIEALLRDPGRIPIVAG
ncbi:GntR family transcriptional regulator [Rhizobium lusitanum]|nr:GntR family transcriptional regulator [Rhizobium lusitanum]